MKIFKTLLTCLIVIFSAAKTFAAVEDDIAKTDINHHFNFSDFTYSITFKAENLTFSKCDEGTKRIIVSYRVGTTGNWIFMFKYERIPYHYFCPQQTICYDIKYKITAYNGFQSHNFLNTNNAPGNGIKYDSVHVAGLPLEFFTQNIEIRIQTDWNEITCNIPSYSSSPAFPSNDYNAGGNKYHDYRYPTNNTNKYNSLTNLRTTQDYYCDKVRLDWDLGTNLTETSDFYDIQRKKMPDGPWGFLDSTMDKFYEDTSTIPGTLYKYKVRTFVQYLGVKHEVGQDSIDGRKPKAVVPSSVYIDQENCQGVLTLNWGYEASSNPENFLIYRSENADFSDSTVWQTSGLNRSYRDGVAASGIRYYYWVKSIVKAGSGCLIVSDTSAAVTEIGNGVPPPPIMDSIFKNTINKSVTINWNDSSNLEDSYKINRSSIGGSYDFTVAENTTNFIDSTASPCVNYTYKVYAVNDQCASNGVGSINTKSTYIPADIKNTFTSSNHKLTASDGEFGDRIELKWKTNNRQNDYWVINRINPLTQDTVQVASTYGSAKFFIDQTANANTLYEYQIFGELDCSGNLQRSDTTTDIGFRLAYGTINGQVTYAGGTAVKDVKVTATSTSGASGYSAHFNGTNALGTIEHSAKLASHEITTMAYIRTAAGNKLQSILEKHDGTNGFKLQINNDSLSFSAGTIMKQAQIPNFSVNNWLAVAATASQDSIKLYVNGVLIKKFSYSGSVFNDSSDATIGKLFQGEIDELRMFDRALTEKEIAQSFNVYINPSMNGLVGYWRFDENFGDKAYDYSKTILTANGNHANLSNVTWSNLKPSTTQLTAGAYTNSLGSYFIPFIPYLGSGDNYTIVPEFGTHSFSPATTTLLIGNGSASYTGQDFTDNSSFTVSGTVKFDSTNCYVKDARLKVDGEVVITNGEVAMTDANGNFEIQVPIGPHIISVEQTGHVYSAGRFPHAGAHDFQQNIQGIEFLDSTLVKVVGRVAGGSIQKATPPALGRGKNNIGLAKIPFKSQQGGGCLVDTAITNTLTGEYAIDLPPMRFEIPNFSIESNAAIQFNNNSLLDISTIPPIQTSKDSIFRDSLGYQLFVRVDSAHYQSQRDFIYFVSPSIDVKGKDVASQFGADTIIYSNSGVEVKIPTDSLGLTYPVFEENKEYSWIISAFEIYENRDKSNPGVLDSVPMTEGSIIIQNNIAKESSTEFEYAITDSNKFSGIQEYNFITGQANTTIDNLNPQYSFTKTAEITLLSDKSKIAQWKPNITDLNSQYFRGYVFGGKALGNSFATAGPQVVTMILRDPPGTGSFASWNTSTAVTNSYSFGVEAGTAANLGTKLSLGTEFSVGLGYTTPTKIELSAATNSTKEISVGVNGDIVEVSTKSVEISTGDGDEFVGADADLFFGRSMNMDFGLSQLLSLIELNKCDGNCSGDTLTFNGNQYRIGTSVSMFAIPKGYQTEFVFTQAGIENSVIPKLEALRNQLLLNDSNYVSILPASDVNFGLSNDDPIFGANATPDYTANSIEDSIGSSYHFKGYQQVDTIYTSPYTFSTKAITYYKGVDSVWWYNKQIALWVNALAENEKSKLLAGSSNLDRNISYQGGSSISYSSSTSRSTSTTSSLNYNLSEEIILAVGAEVGGIGGEVEQSTSISLKTNATLGTVNETTATFAYTLSDPDASDEFSVDVFKSSDGYGPIFKTRGGQTACPYQGESKTKYYNKGTIIDKATIQLDQPEITVSPSTLFNIPAKDAGNITVNLINNGPEDNVYTMRIMENSNPYGAILKIDGLGPNRDFSVPAKSSITKTLTVEKGPNHIKYDSIGIIFHSKCQFAFGTANYEDIADTVYISVNFLPSCTDISIQSPQNQFVANNSFNEVLPVVISGYDINYGGLEKIQLQYKPSNQASWIPLGREWFKDTNNIQGRYPNHPDPQLIPRNQSYIDYSFEMEQLIDQDYDLRAIATCMIPQNPNFDQQSTVVSGRFDRVNPHPFGNPSPADGVLDPNDDISIQFNEDIEAGSLTPSNFQVTGVLNGQELRHNKAVAFDGATGYLEIANGFDFASDNFTIEFWAKRNTLGSRQTIISQGSSIANMFSVLFNESNKLEVTIGDGKYVSNFAVLDDSTWHHYTITYDKEDLTLEINNRFQNSIISSSNNNFYASFESGGKTYIGKNSSNNSEFFDGSIHELRIWNKALPSNIVSSRINKNLTGSESGLIGYWPMNEGYGDLIEDKARYRHAEMHANWELNPKSFAATFDGISQYVVVDSAGTIAITQEMDLSIEFWFKTTGGRLQTLFSNGSGRFKANDANRNGWNIEMNAQNEIWVKNDSFAFKAVETDYADNKWHHFALVVNRLSNTTAFIDGNQQNSTNSSNFYGFGASKLVIGARFSMDGSIETLDQYFHGQIDEIRIWNTALLRENIELNQYNRLMGDEFGLLAYYPFESYHLELGVPVLDASLDNQSSILSNPSRINAKAVNGSVYTSESPAIALQRPVEKIKFSWSVNGDKVVITPNEAAANIENVSLNVAVKEVKDLSGNVMQSPKTWLAYVNKNQVLWQDIEKNLSKELNDTLTFTSKVINSGGEVKNFTISNIPAWLTAVPSSGKIDPLEQKIIHFSVNPSVNIGTYAEDIMLSTDFGFNEKLFVRLKVSKTPPDFKVNPSLYQQSMSVIGQIRINGQVSTNEDDMLIAFINGEVRGVTNLVYIPSYDKYLAFLDIYSNSMDSVYFKVWNASIGVLHAEVSPVLNFTNNNFIGSPSKPEFFDAINNISKPIALKKGWNWVSFPLQNPNMNNFHGFFKSLDLQAGDLVKTIGDNANAQYGGTGIGWAGNLVGQGLSNELSYLIKLQKNDTLDYKGLAIDPDTLIINVYSGWNRIGFISLKNISIQTALANFNAQNGDFIKSQEQFAYYDENLGWIGSLKILEPTKGYLLKSLNDTSFVYPRQGFLRLKQELDSPKGIDQMLAEGYTLDPHDFEAGVSAIIKVDGCEAAVENENTILAAFKDDVLRGWSESATKLNEEIGYQYYLTAYGEAMDQFNFALIDTSSMKMLPLSGTLNYEKDGVVGTPSSPMPLLIDKNTDCEEFKNALVLAGEFSSSFVYPNPFRDNLNVIIPSDLGEIVEVSIIDSYGRIIHREMALANSTLNWNKTVKSFSKGVYYIRFKTDQGLKVEKVVKN